MCSIIHMEYNYCQCQYFVMPYKIILFYLTVEQEQIQKRTFTNWINAQLSKVNARTSQNRVKLRPELLTHWPVKKVYYALCLWHMYMEQSYWLFIVPTRQRCTSTGRNMSHARVQHCLATFQAQAFLNLLKQVITCVDLQWSACFSSQKNCFEFLVQNKSLCTLVKDTVVVYVHLCQAFLILGIS